MSETSGTIPPNASFKVTIKFSPTIVNLTSCAHYTIRTVGGNELTFSCIGHASGFDVKLSTTSLHFGEV